MKEPRGKELVNRYKKNYHIPTDAKVTEEMILAHWELEKRLAKELLESNAENRWEAFERCYTTLYRELDWLNCLVGADVMLPRSQRYKNMLYLLGKPPKRIYEVGSGKAGLISYLASCGFECKGTEVTRSRGQMFTAKHPNLSWGTSDGVHLDLFETPNSYDVVITDQVIEHLHPDDLHHHFRGALSILVSGGRYILLTPHRYVGPGDISGVFKCDRLMGMHLREYDYRELRGLFCQTGFKTVRAVLSLPSRFAFPFFEPIASQSYLTYLCALEKLILLFSPQAVRRRMSLLLMFALFRPSIFLVAEKG